jgi:hypothetical protein
MDDVQSQYTEPAPGLDAWGAKELGDQLNRVITLRVNQAQIVWRIFAAFWAANAILMVALFRDGRFPDDRAAAVSITSVGLVLSVTWFGIQRRALGHIDRFEKLMARLEMRLGVPPDLALSGSINREDYSKCVPPGPHGRPLMLFFNFVAAGLWLAALLWLGVFRS